jgi:hypothetical protein
MRRTRVPFRARRQGSDRVGEKLPVDDVGQSAFEATGGFLGCLACGDFPVVGGTAFAVGLSEVDDGHDVQDPVDLPIATAVRCGI